MRNFAMVLKDINEKFRACKRRAQRSTQRLTAWCGELINFKPDCGTQLHFGRSTNVGRPRLLKSFSNRIHFCVNYICILVDSMCQQQFSLFRIVPLAQRVLPALSVIFALDNANLEKRLCDRAGLSSNFLSQRRKQARGFCEKMGTTINFSTRFDIDAPMVEPLLRVNAFLWIKEWVA